MDPPLHQSLFSIERGRGHFAAVFNLGHVFASLTENILLWRKMKLSWSHTDAKKKIKNRSCFIHTVSTPRVAGNIVITVNLKKCAF